MYKLLFLSLFNKFKNDLLTNINILKYGLPLPSSLSRLPAA